MFLGKAVIIGLSAFIAYIIIMNSELKDKVNSPIFPVIVVIVIAYLIGSIFLSVYSFASTAILHCFILSEDLGLPEHPKCLDTFITVNDKYNVKKNKGKGGDSGNSAPAGNKKDGPDDGVKGQDEKNANSM